MITLYRAEQDRTADKIEEKLKNLVVAFRAVVLSRSDAKEVLSRSHAADMSIPCLKEGDNWISGEQKVGKYLAELEQELQIQRSISGDACYIDPDTGDIC